MMALSYLIPWLYDSLSLFLTVNSIYVVILVGIAYSQVNNTWETKVVYLLINGVYKKKINDGINRITLYVKQAFCSKCYNTIDSTENYCPRVDCRFECRNKKGN